MSDLLQSRPFRPDASKCCEACIFGSGEHADWCAENLYANKGFQAAWESGLLRYWTPDQFKDI